MTSKQKVVKSLSHDVFGSVMEWNLEKGNFSFQGGDAVLFWISTAMKTFFDTIEEVSGDDAANVVLEATGYRQGIVVSEHFNSLNLTMDTVIEALPKTYASAGWGKLIFKEVNEANSTAVIQLKNSWEYKINKAQNKNVHGSFLPGHFAGLLTGLFKKNVWYKVTKSQLEGDEYCEYEYFPTHITASDNIHDLSRRKESEAIQELERQVEERTKELKELVKEISSPIIPVLEGIVVVPLLGKYDESRSEELIERTLTNLPKYQASYLVLDLTGLDTSVSTYTADFIHKLGTAASMLGTETILVGISAELSMTITNTNLNLSRFNCFTTLQHGIYFALSQTGRKII